MQGEDNRPRASRMSPQDRREYLIQSAIRTFADRGIGETSHSALARDARIALPTMFHYFPTRSDIVKAALDEVMRFLLEDLLRGHAGPERAAPLAIEAILMAFCDAIDTYDHYVRVWLEWSVSIRGDLWKSYLVFYERAREGHRQILERGIREGSVRPDIVIDDATRIIVGLAHVIVQMKYSGSSREQVTRTVHSLAIEYLSTEHAAGKCTASA
ncbi:TetR/AcrR family transcriptional regulator [Croceicoccus ponticola]|uniref:TetR/AcrR family transcriptional regulator n=1 Tax=Croceicoccus ponticola TaxID=2217664 RepID=A0A437GW83_9SPHN|nr:TetR/AcrR family transcriptional regulator [Croceicoccus ponticola]RVQ66352.1 TetR/AcrR family transcriptional regulator [Croceicoccus ponticola]